MPSGDHEGAIAALEATGNYRVLRRHQPTHGVALPPDGARRGLLVDVETTGLDPEHDEIIELAMVPFFYSNEGQIVGIGKAFDRLREPKRPISADVTRLTGISDTMVAGRTIEPAEVEAFAANSLVVAHNAAFDRRFLEKFCPSLRGNPWACSMCEINWAGEGFESSKLAYLALSSGFYYDRHRAVHDCHATIELLTRTLGASGEAAFAKLLRSARATSLRCWAENSPFEAKDLLKRRGYRWNGEENGQPRAWWVDVPEPQLESERAFLATEIYKRDFPLRTARVTAFNRYSDRITPD